ncbi:transposase [Variovorax sp. RB2P76]|uniref:transposase n=1 Tax=unclassified Variovorax TaxID=663243 RepID=UPI003F46D73A
MSIPGIGPVTALTFKSAVHDPARFKASCTVAAHYVTTRAGSICPLNRPGSGRFRWRAYGRSG